MSKWTTITTINDIPTTEKKRERQADSDFYKLMKKTPSRTIDEMKEHAEELAKTQKIEDSKLLDAFTNKKLKSKAAIKKALGLSKKRNDAGKSKDKAVNPQVEVTAEGQ